MFSIVKKSHSFSWIDQWFHKDTSQNSQLYNNFIETNHSFTSVVLKRFPEDEDGKILLESIDTIILEREEGTKKKNSKRVGTCLCFLRIRSLMILKDPAKT